MEILDFKKVLFHGLGNQDEKSFEILESILKTGAILSKNQQLKHIGIFNQSGNKNWNGDDYISICRKLPGDQDITDAYNYFVSYESMGIILSEDLLHDLPVRKTAKLMKGELQIPDSIDQKYFLGIVVFLPLPGFIFRDYHLTALNKAALSDIVQKGFEPIHKINALLEKYNYELPVYHSVTELPFQPSDIQSVTDKAYAELCKWGNITDKEDVFGS